MGVTNPLAEARTTHPWLTFEINLRRIDGRAWAILGEVASRCARLSGIPLRPDTAKKLHSVYLARGAAATTQIEGNSITAKEVERRLQGRITVPPSRRYLWTEVDNVVKAYTAIWRETLRTGSSPLTVDRIKTLHRRVTRGLRDEEEIQPGRLRTEAVGVADYRAPEARLCEPLLAAMCEMLNKSIFDNTWRHARASTGIIRAIVAHVYLAWIHPFNDGNGRTARLIEFQMLVSAGVPSISAHVLTNHYNHTRTEYYAQLSRASKTGGDLTSFITYALEGLADGLDEQMDLIKEEHRDMAWRSHCHAALAEFSGKSKDRSVRVALDVSRVAGPVRMSDVPSLTPALSAMYRNLSQRTLRRDIARAIEHGLLKYVDPAMIVANRDAIHPFLVQSIPEDRSDH